MLLQYPLAGYDPLNNQPKQGNVMNPFKRNLLFATLVGTMCGMVEDAAGGATETLLDLDTVEGMSFDDIKQPPGFVTPPDGVYKLNLSKAAIEKYTTKEKDGQPSEQRKRFAHYYTIEEVMEVASNEQAPAVGSKFSERFMMNEKGLGYWKQKAKDIIGDLGTGVTVANVLNELNSGSYTFTARIQNKQSKGSDGKDYTNTNVRIVKQDAGQAAEQAAGVALP